MCGRFSLTSQEQEINLFFGLSGGNAPYIPRYNGAPTQLLPVITRDEPKRLQLFRWGLIPHWAKEVPRVPLINARSETLDQKISFKSAFHERRCLVPADGFYEWLHTGNKLPYRFMMADNSLFAFAGLWETWNNPNGESINSFTILTTGANEIMKPIHDRMPVILDKGNINTWLNQDNDRDLKMLLKPYASNKMKKYRVSKEVNKATAEGPELIAACEPLEFFDGDLF
ncbi:MAG: SOS response-associated peptidase [Lentimicrobiaceae bacterium]